MLDSRQFGRECSTIWARGKNGWNLFCFSIQKKQPEISAIIKRVRDENLKKLHQAAFYLVDLSAIEGNDISRLNRWLNCPIMHDRDSIPIPADRLTCLPDKD